MSVFFPKIQDALREATQQHINLVRQIDLINASQELQKTKHDVKDNKILLMVAALIPVAASPGAIIFFAATTLTTPMLTGSIIVGVVALAIIGVVCIKLYKKIRNYKAYAPERNFITSIINNLNINRGAFLSVQFADNLNTLNTLILDCNRFSNKVQLTARINALQTKIQSELTKIEYLQDHDIYQTLFDSLGAFPSPALNQDFYHEILDRTDNRDVADALAEYLVTYMPSQTPLQLCYRIVHRGNRAAEIFASHLVSSHAMNGTTASGHIEFCKQLINHSSQAATALAKGCAQLNLLGLTFAQRLEIYSELIKKQTAAPIFVSNIRQVDLTRTTVAQRLELYEKIIHSWGDPSITTVLASNIRQLDLTGTTVDQRLELYEKIIKRSPEAAAEMAKQVINGTLNLTGATVDQCMQFYGSLIDAGVFSAESIAKSIDQLDLNNFTSEQRFQLYTKILSQKGELTLIPNAIGAAALLENVDKLVLDKEHRVALYTHFAEIDYSYIIGKGESCPWDFAKFNLHDFTHEERVTLYTQMVRGHTGFKLAENFGSIKLTSSEWLNLGKKYLENDHSIKDLIFHFVKVPLEDKELFDFVNCIISRHLEHKFIECEYDFFFSLKARHETTKRQILIDFLSSLSGLGGGYDLSQFKSFTSDIKVPLNVLNKKADQAISEDEIVALKQFINAHPKLKSLARVVENREKEISGSTLAKQRFDLMRWAAYAAVALHGLESHQITALTRWVGPQQHGGIVLELISRNQQYRYHLLRASCLTVKNSNRLHDAKWQDPATFLLAPLAEFGSNSPEALETWCDSIDLISVGQNQGVFDALAQALIEIGSKGPYLTQESHDILSKLSVLICKPLVAKIGQPQKLSIGQPQKLSTDKFLEGVNEIAPELIKQLAAVANLFQIGKDYGFAGLKSHDTSNFFQLVLRENFGAENVNHIELRYRDTFGRFKEPNAIFACVSSIEKLSKRKIKAAKKRSDQAKEMFSRFIISVLNENFHQLRYATASNSQLQQLINFNPQILTSWCTGIKRSLSNVQVEEAEQKEKEEQSDNQYNDLEILETDNPEHLMMLQDDAESDIFASHLMDGTRRAIVVTERGKAVGTAFIHLELDEKERCPVLVMQDIYTFTSFDNNTFLHEAINKLAQEKASSMGIKISL
jgi:DNA-binding GntR family transcriptional regulator